MNVASIFDPKHLAQHLSDETEPVAVTVERGFLTFEGKAWGGWRCSTPLASGVTVSADA